ncbi:MBL fold metallo-hydrolase [Dethiothermospora halolimnae]|uniref:MBL fold metallo-hydrolase n=1 Tax=Dethiothermospora halolimnae TaxID=3114390 RepID=UPI003CCC442A
MEENKVNIVHLGHSSFLIETKENILIFDYYDDKPDVKKRTLENGVVSGEKLKTDKNIFVFVTHSHSDHYNPIIFKWKETNPNIRYILSNDIKDEVDSNKYKYMNPYEITKIDEIEIKTYGSTDKGVSFLVKVDGLNIFHSGDLNWWHWKSFSKEELEVEERDYKNEINKVMENNIDIAFVPVDPRLEEFYYLAAEHFIEEIKPKLMVPMHFGDDFNICNKLINKIGERSTQIADITHVGKEISFTTK